MRDASKSSLPAGTASPWVGSDSDLVAFVRSGHVNASKWLYDRFARQITRVVFRILGGDADQEDLVQDIFVRIWTLISAGKVRDPTALGAWVMTVATHIIYKELRRRYVRQRFLKQHEDSPIAVSYVRDAEARDLLLGVYRVLADMPPAHRLIFGLRYLDQRTLVELASLCDISVATAKRRLTQAERTFARLVRRHGDNPALYALVPAKKQRG